MSDERHKAISPDQFPPYLDQVVKLNQRPRYLVQTLRASANNFGLAPMQMELLIKVTRSLKLLDFDHEFSSTTISKVPKTYLSAENFPSLAGLIFFGYNQFLASTQPHDRTTMEKLYPEAIQVIPEIHRQIESYPEVLKAYPAINDRLLLPTFPPNPQTKIDKTKNPFTLGAFLPEESPSVPDVPEFLFQDSESIQEIRRRIEQAGSIGQLFGEKNPQDKGVLEIDWSQIDLNKPPG